MEKYTTFREDIENYLHDSILKFNLKLNLEISEKKFGMPQYRLYYNNQNGGMMISCLDSFPYYDAVPHFFLFDANKNSIEIKYNHLLQLLKINEHLIMKYALNFDKNNSEIKTELCGGKFVYGEIKYALCCLNRDILQFYQGFFEGKVTYKDYENYLISLNE